MDLIEASKATKVLEGDYVETISKAYKNALSSVRLKILDYAEKYGMDGALTMETMQRMSEIDRKEVTRLQRLFDAIDTDLNALNRGRPQELAGHLTSVFMENYSNGAKEIENLAGVAFNVINRDAVYQSAVSPLGKIALQSNADAIKTNIRRSITTSLVQGETIAKMTQRIKIDLETNANNATRIARTETNRVEAEARDKLFDDASSQGVNIQRVWLAANDSRTRDSHLSADGQKRNVDDPFLINGFKMKRPGDSSLGAPASEVINCRCSLIAYLPDYEDEKDIERQNQRRQAFAKEAERRKIAKAKVFTAPPKSTGPDVIAGAKLGKPMTRDEANHGKPNPNFEQRGGYSINCQSCVVTYEARLRGYDVEVLPNTRGSVLEKLSRQTNLAWIDPVTNTHPEYIFDKNIVTAKAYYQYMENIVENGKRYTIEFAWKGRSRSGHIISLDRDADGIIRFYDPQSGKTFVGSDVKSYISRFKFVTSAYGFKITTPPRILRVDDKLFNMDVASNIMKATK